jgi:serine/threonine protein kinase/formylglycine-generating enzyme required for sulfatase activity
MLTDSDLAQLLAALEGGLPRDALAATLRAAVYGGRVAMRVALEAAQASIEIDSTQIDAGPRPSLASLPGAPAPAPGAAETPRDFEQRYALGEELGRGGAGRVVEAHDRLFGRSVAVKILLGRDPGPMRRFITEARTTARLDHPGVVPVHDLGLLPDGTPCFVMKRVQGRSLKTILSGLEGGDPAIQAAFGRYRLLRILIGVGQAVDFAHAHGVVHRDLKPDNIMVGDFGEVLVMDWGVAKVLGEVPADPPLNLPVVESQGTLAGSIIGTPGYMPPEQARGEHSRIDGRADVWALGAILHEVLTGRRPFQSEGGVLGVLVATSSRDVPPASQTAPHREIPSDLEEICARALARDPTRRYPTAGALCEDIELYLTGTRELERRTAEADRLVTDGEESIWYLGMLRDELALLQERLGQEPALTGQEPLAHKRTRWSAEDRCTALEAEQRQAFGWAEARLARAIELAPGHVRARGLLADLHWRRYREARAAQDPVAADEHLKAVARARPDDPRLREPVMLRLHTEPSGALVLLSRVVEQDRVLVRIAERSLEHTPVATPVPTGRSTLEIRVPGRRPVLLPVMAWQGDALDLSVAVPTNGALGPDFVFVPGGEYVRGTDPEAILPRPAGLVYVPPFAIGRYPVMCGEYFEFLNSMPRDEALRHAPRSLEDGLLVAPGSQGWRVPCLDNDGDQWEPAWPIFNVSYEDAEAFARWRSARDNARYRLPTEDEWEKAARGTDGRVFPWGDHFDPTFCRMRTSIPGDLLPRPVGSFPTDTSPYGVVDMAGGVREWVDGWIEPGLRSARGGAFNHYAFLCRAASRFGYGPKSTIVGLGFRLVKDL